MPNPISERNLLQLETPSKKQPFCPKKEEYLQQRKIMEDLTEKMTCKDVHTVTEKTSLCILRTEIYKKKSTMDAIMKISDKLNMVVHHSKIL